MSKLMKAALTIAVITAGFAGPATATVLHSRHRLRHRRVEGRRIERVAARPLIVRRRRPNPFHGPAAIVTAPVTVAGMFVGLPFRALGLIFPAHGNPADNPLVLVGAPLHLAGRIAEFPFYAVDYAFGKPTRLD